MRKQPTAQFLNRIFYLQTKLVEAHFDVAAFFYARQTETAEEEVFA